MKSYYLQQSLTMFITALFLVNSTDLTSKFANSIKFNGKYSSSEVILIIIQNEANKIKLENVESLIPDMPDKMPKEVEIMQVKIYYKNRKSY